MRNTLLKMYVKAQILRDALKDESGQDLIEYALVVSLIAMIVGSVLLYLDWDQYPTAKAPALPALPALPAEFSYADRFVLSIQGALFNQLKTLTLTESQNRFVASISRSAPFESAGSLVVPTDFLVNGTLKFSATAEDAAGNRNSIGGSTLVVSSSPDTAIVETKFDTGFPTVDSTWDQPSKNISTRLTSTFGSSMVNQFQFSYANNRIFITTGLGADINQEINSKIPEAREK